MDIIKLRLFLVKNQAVVLVLCALLQRMPVIKHLIQFEKALSAPMANLIRSATVTVASLGGFHGIAGATTFSTNPTSPATANVGESFQMAFAITGTPENAESWELIGSLPPGLSIPEMTNNVLNSELGTITGVPTEAGNFSFSLKPYDRPNRGGDTTSPFNINILVQASALPPTITSNPLSLSVLPGNRAQFIVAFEGSGTIEWLKNGQPIGGANGTSFVIPTVLESDAGSYSARVTNDGASATSAAATLTVSEGISSKLINLSNLTAVGVSKSITTPGFFINGSAAKTILVRAVGQELGPLGVGDFLADPFLRVFRGQTQLAANDDWQVDSDASELQNAMNQVAPGFLLSNGSKSAAVLLTVPPGPYSAQVSSANGSSGSVIFEVYEID